MEHVTVTSGAGSSMAAAVPIQHVLWRRRVNKKFQSLSVCRKKQERTDTHWRNTQLNIAYKGRQVVQGLHQP